MKMRRLTKRFVCIILSIILLTSMMLNINVVAATDGSDKIETYLEECLRNMDGSDMIDVSVWLTGVDEHVENEKIYDAIHEKVINGDLPDEIFALLPYLSSDKEKDYYDYMSELENDLTTDQVQLMISTKRRVLSDLYEENNTEKLQMLFTKERTEQGLVFQSHYSPNVVMNLSKDEIYEISRSDLVDYVYIYDDNVQLEDESDIIADDEIDEEVSYEITEFQYEMTGIAEMRDEQHLTGEGIKIGIFDTSYSSPNLVDYIASDTIQAYLSSSSLIKNTYYTHGSNVAYLIAGNYTDQITSETYLGVAPDADLYLTASSDVPHEYRMCLEQLLDYGVNIISCSLRVGYDGLNNYGDAAMWIDHISSQHNVLFVSSAGNSGSSGITSGKFGYNLLAVGSCNSDGELSYFSSYSTLNNNLFKPDLVAPGEGIVTPSTKNNALYHQGTSWAAPIVAGAAAQLCQSSAFLLSYPRLLKSTILAGTTLNTYIVDEDDMITTNTNAADNKFSRKYGAGILNVANSYDSCVINDYKSCGYVPYFVNNVSFSKQVSVNEGDLIRVCAAWDKKTFIDGTHTISNVSTPGLENYLLEVRTPSGESYRALYYYDNKDMVTFVAQESGVYKVWLVRMSSSINSFTSFGITLSVQDNSL